VAKEHGLDPAHHPFPVPHRGHDGNADGFLTYSDALERSCNIFFETVAYRLKLEGLTYWMKQFGLGRPTGIGLAEVRGRVPDSYIGPNTLFATCTSGIGQSAVAATPLQMCNVAATIARRGIWMRPNIVSPGYDIARYRPKNVPAGDSAWDDIPSRMDLHIAPEAIDAAFDGMKRVVNDFSAGTGTTAFCDLAVVAGKTGTAQASPFLVAQLDENNQPVLDADKKPVRVPLTPSTHDKPDPNHPWYRATDETGKMLNHAWFIGFVPADHPKYAISVMVEYGGGGGGIVAGPIANKIVYALIEHQYLQPAAGRHITKEQID
jgi:penicillin-binding protein 2